jgi:hypothetical protein
MNQTAKISHDELKREIVGPCGFNYNIPLESGEISFGANYWRTAKIYWAPDNIDVEPGYGLLSAQVTYKLEGNRWAFRFFGEPS